MLYIGRTIPSMEESTPSEGSLKGSPKPREQKTKKNLKN
jgi:hypothetical protein